MIKIKDLNFHDRMDLVMAILNTTTVDHHHLPGGHPIRQVLNDAWLAAFDARKLFRAEMNPQHSVGSNSMIEAFEMPEYAGQLFSVNKAPSE